MALSYVATGAPASGTSNMTPAFPAGIAVDDLLVMVVASGEADDAVPSVNPVGGPWAYQGSEVSTAGTFGAGTGPRRLTYFTRQYATGDGPPIMALPASTGVTMSGVIFALRKASTEAWSVISPEFGDETTSGTAWSQALTSIPSRMATGAFLAMGFATPANSAGISVEGVTATGATIGTVTERAEAGSAVGNTVRVAVATASVTAGTATAAPVLTATLSVAATGVVGAMVILATTSSLTAQQAYRGDPVRINECKNPSAEAGVTTGVLALATTGAVTTDVVDVEEEGLGYSPSSTTGRRAFRVTGAATNTTTLGIGQSMTYPKPIGTVMTVSFDMYLPAATPVDQILVGWAAPGGAIFATSTMASVSTGWRRYSATYTTAAALGDIYVYTNDAGNARGADTIYVDNMCFEVGSSAGTYFDGNTGDPQLVNVWTGTALLSESAQYAASSPPRVGVTLNNWGTDNPTTVYRVHPDGSRYPVRGGNVTPSGGAAFVWDYEFPTNTEVYYVADDAGTERSTAILDEVVVRRNGVLNPTLGVDATNWAVFSGAKATSAGTRVTGSTTDGPVIGGVRRDYWRMTFSAVTDGTPGAVGPFYPNVGTVLAVEATPGPWTASLYWRCNVPDRTVRLIVTFYNAANAAIGADVNGPVSAPGLGRWQRVSATLTAPAGSTHALVRLFGEGGGNNTTSTTLDVTGLLVEDDVATVGTYFDGDTPGIGYRWQGTADASWSEQYLSDVITSTVVEDNRSFLRAPGLPGLDCVVRVGRNPAKSRPRPVTYLTPIGRRTQVPLAGARQARQFTLDFLALTDAEAEALVALMDGAATAYLLFPGSTLHGTYVSLGDLSEAPNPTLGPKEVGFSVPAVEVERPAGGVAFDPYSSWATLLATSSSWQAVLNTYPSWLDVLRGPPTAG